MNSVVLTPYCPMPADSGGKAEMWKHLDVLRGMGSCTMVSAATKPVGAGWTPEKRADAKRRGFSLVLREDARRGRSFRQFGGIAYAALAKGLRMEKAFGHSNPYHRHAFPADWWLEQTKKADLAVINYSYWAGLPCACPKVIILHDLLSGFMWEGPRREIEDLKTADLVIVISKDEENKLNRLGITRTMWSPPAVPGMDCPDSDRIGLVGSSNASNREGLRWLARSVSLSGVRVYGGLAAFASGPGFIRVGRYESTDAPYLECGVILLPTALGMGVQIKSIEALAAGRAIVARRGAMRGIPPGDGAWLEVDTPEQMMEEAGRLVRDAAARKLLGRHAHNYYERHLNSDQIRADMARAFTTLAGRHVSCPQNGIGAIRGPPPPH